MKNIDFPTLIDIDGIAYNRLISLSELNADVPEVGDAPSTILTPYALQPGDVFFGDIGFDGDADWIEVVLQAGTTYQFVMSDTDTDNVLGTWLQLYDADGNYLAGEFSYTEYTSTLYYQPTESSTFFISAEGYSGTAIGSYTVSFDEIVLDPLPTYSAEEVAHYLTDGYWADAGGARHHFDVSKNSVITVDITTLSDDGQALATAALEVWENYSGLSFELTSDGFDADINFFDTDPGAYSDYVLDPDSPDYIAGSGVNVSTDWVDYYGTSANGYSFQTYLHEIGHALGLGHAGPYNGSAQYNAFGLGDNGYLNDSWQLSIMSYFDQSENTSVDASFGFVITPMVADIIAIQDLYSDATPKFKNGDTTYDLEGKHTPIAYSGLPQVGNDYVFTVFDTGGSDKFDFSATDQDQIINLNAEHYSDVNGGVGNIGIARGVIIEDAKGGAGVDKIIGNQTANTLKGKDGNDYLFGGSRQDKIKGGGGEDVIWGERGRDKLWGGEGADTFHFNAGDGRDSIKDFEVGLDQIDLAGTSATEYADLRIETSSGNTKIWIDDIRIFLKDVRVGNLDADDFIFA